MDFDEISAGVGRGPRNNELDFGGDPNNDPYPGIFQKILCLVLRFLQTVKNKKAVLSQGNRAMPQLFFSV